MRISSKNKNPFVSSSNSYQTLWNSTLSFVENDYRLTVTGSFLPLGSKKRRGREICYFAFENHHKKRWSSKHRYELNTEIYPNAILWATHGSSLELSSVDTVFQNYSFVSTLVRIQRNRGSSRGKSWNSKIYMFSAVWICQKNFQWNFHKLYHLKFLLA